MQYRVIFTTAIVNLGAEVEERHQEFLEMLAARSHSDEMSSVCASIGIYFMLTAAPGRSEAFPKLAAGEKFIITYNGRR
jgi:hypothetical protein